MERKLSLALFLAIITMLLLSSTAQAATLSWGAVTTYTDGTTIPASKTITYAAKSGASATGPWTTEGTTSSLSASVSEPAAGTTKYYTVSCSVDGVSSANATAVSKSAPFPTPSAPTGLGIQ